nr:PREDICTED: exocyst complex component 3-like protein [Latimeria chalumnae]|eukprot:XP_005988026.1 PREDICTED: exocyst complex component 3-like protein [Latimeria chalumnae]
MSAGDDPVGNKDEIWPEMEKAEKLARGAALKWASGVFYKSDQLEKLGQYRKREAQRTSSVQSRLKSAVHSYLEGVGVGLGQLRLALEDVRSVCHALGEVRQDWQGNIAGFKRLEQLRGMVSEHVRLATVVHNLPQVFSVPEVVMETERLIQSRRVLEAHTKLMELECWRDDILYQIHRAGQQSSDSQEIVLSYFTGVKQLNEELAKELWDVVGCGLTFVRHDPAIFVSAVRIIEREEKIDQIILEGQSQHLFLPPGRPKNWRQKFFEVIEEAISAQFRATHVDIKGPGLASHLAALQNNIMNDLTVVKHLMVQCCPPHYNIFSAFVRMYHKCLSRHMQDIISWELEKNEIFSVLNWTLHVYNSPEMMGHPDLCPEVDITTFGPLISHDALEQLQNKYVATVRDSVSEWMQKALEAEVKDWFREEEPETDHEGYFQSSLPAIIIQMLEENVRVSSAISDSLRGKVIGTSLNELESFFGRFRKALLNYGKEHLKDRLNPKHYLLYLVMAVNNCIAFRTSISTFLEQHGLTDLGFHGSPPSISSTLDKAMKKACRLLLDELLLDLQPHFVQLLSRSWLAGSDCVDDVCRVVDQYCNHFSGAREPVFQGLEQSNQMTSVISSLSELIRLKDTTLLSLEVSGLITKYPDISDEHVSVLLDIRGDVSKEVRGTVLEVMEQSSQPPPEDYQPIFTDILVPAPVLTFCLPTVKCA